MRPPILLLHFPPALRRGPSISPLFRSRPLSEARVHSALLSRRRRRRHCFPFSCATENAIIIHHTPGLPYSAVLFVAAKCIFLKKRREKNSSIIPSHAGVPSFHPNTAEAAQGEEGSAVSIIIEGEEDVQEEEDSAAKKLEEFFRPRQRLHSAEAEDRRADSEARRTSSPSASGSEVGGERERESRGKWGKWGDFEDTFPLCHFLFSPRLCERALSTPVTVFLFHFPGSWCPLFSLSDGTFCGNAVFFSFSFLSSLFLV